MPEKPRNLNRGVVDLKETVNALNRKAPGAGDQLFQVIHHLNNRADAQAGHAGTVGIPQQPTDNAGNVGVGLDLGGSRIQGLANPIHGTDVISLDFYRRNRDCDWLLKKFEECFQVPRVVARPGNSSFTYSQLTASEIYVYPNSDFVLLSGLHMLFPLGQPTFQLGVIENPALEQNAPITVRGTYQPADPARDGKSITTFSMLDAPRNKLYAGSGQTILGSFGRDRVATIFNTFDISNVDGPIWQNTEIVLFIDGPPGANGITTAAVSGVQAYGFGKAVVFGGNPYTPSSPPTANDLTNNFYYTVDVASPTSPVVGNVFGFDGVVGEFPHSSGSPIAAAIGPGDICYLIWDHSEDFTLPNGRTELISLHISGSGLSIANRQILHTNSLRGIAHMQVSPDNTLHILSRKYPDPYPTNPRHRGHWTIYDITTPGSPVRKSDTVSPCNDWISFYADGTCVLLIEVGGFPPSSNNATLWDASDPAHPELIGGCLQRETNPVFSGPQETFLRDNQGYYIGSASSRFVRHDFEGHGITC